MAEESASGLTDKLPKSAYGLIELLDDTVQRPAFPSHIQGWSALDPDRLRALAFTAGARALVDQLVQQMKEEQESRADSLSDGPPSRYARVLGEGRDVHTLTLDIDGLDPPSPE